MGLSFGIEKEIIAKIAKVDDLTDEFFRQVVQESYVLIYPVEVVESYLDGLVSRVLSRIQELQTQEEKANNRGRARKTFGSSYAEWLSELDATSSCLYLADYDITKALHYYWEEDYLIVQEAIRIKSGHESQITLTRMEASMYGFGGKYADDKGGDGNTVDLDSMAPDDIKAMMAGMGF